MKGVVKGKDLAEATGQLKGILSRKQTLPILSGTHLELVDGKAILRGTDLEQGLAIEIPAEVEAPGQLVVIGEKFGALAKAVAAEDVSLAVGTVLQLEVRTASGRWKLAAFEAQDFPMSPPVSAVATVTVAPPLLVAALKKVAYAISTDESRYALNGVLLEVVGVQAQLTATDGHRMARVGLPLIESTIEKRSLIVPTAAVKTLQSLARGLGDEVRVGLGENMLEMVGGRFQFSSKLIEGRFPNVDIVLDGARKNDRVLVAQVASLAEAVRRAILITAEAATPITLRLLAEGSKVIAQSPETGDAEVDLPATWQGAALTIAMNGRYVLEYLESVGAGEIQVKFKTELDPIFWCGEGAPEYVLMPMRV
jgi:DNA polymerase-3 subunit beta